MVQIYGSARSSGGRCYLMLEEVGVPYEAKPIDMMDKREHKDPEYLKLNPNGKVPCLVDGDYVLWESLAINTYLAAKYKPELLGKTPEERGLIEQWSVWAVGELQVPMIDILIQSFTPEAKRDATVVAKARDKMPGLFKILDNALAGKTYILGSTMTLADINLASVVNIAPALQIPLNDYISLSPWFHKMKERPSFKKYADIRGK